LTNNYFRSLLRTASCQRDQGQNSRTDQPGRKCHSGGEKQAISLRNSRPFGLSKDR